MRRASVATRPLFRDRDDEEVRGYRDALALIHRHAKELPVGNETICRLHALTRGQIWDAGEYKVPPPIPLAAFNLDFLCIHPFRDGKGRVSRLLWLLQGYQLGDEVGRYISLERLIEENKDRYYETLEQSSRGWHEGAHDPWPYINFVLSIMKDAYRDLVDRVGALKAPRGEKRQMVVDGIEQLLARSRTTLSRSASWSSYFRASAVTCCVTPFGSSRSKES
ncbi:Fic family protein [Thiocapsa roseopersicina]|uniref:Fic/DOC family protein n=1 Tax=Thiocapsa roseopersicina TaxID=1058 RepID=A0A1H3B6G5_THIRO|nr:Fic family protein [Thiocapsa roseopersicina]SDX37221.1 Fic/DOC family protein [Thiocapsa roseopersicina]